MGVYNVKYKGEVLKKRCNAFDDGTCNRKKGNDWGYDDLNLVHYTGDNTTLYLFGIEMLRFQVGHLSDLLLM